MDQRRKKPSLDSRPIRHREDRGYPESGAYRQRGGYTPYGARTGGGLSEEERRRRAAARRRERLRKKKRQRIALLAALALLVVVVAVALFFLLRPQEELPPVDFSGGSSHAAGAGGSSAASDTEAPVITGVQDQTVEVGDAISYKSGVTVTDNVDTDLDVTVDASQVDLEVPGSYTVTYTAVDAAGNEAVPVTATITVVEPDPGAANEEEMMAMAQSVLDSIVTDDMSQMEQAQAIYDWCHYQISYVDSSDKSSWINGAIQAFESRSGDCFN